MKSLSLLAGLCTLLCLGSCSSEHKEQEEKINYVVTSPVVIDTTLRQDYVAQIRSIRNIEIRALERGYLEKIYVDEGQFVKQGQLLFKIMPRVYEAEQAKAQAEASAAEIELRNTKVLADSNVVSVNELNLAKARLAKAKAELTLAQTHLAFTDIRAPFDGIVDRLHLKLGSLVSEGDLLTSLSDNRQMWVYFNVAEAEYLNLKSRQDDHQNLGVKLQMANNEMFDYDGKIETIEGEFDNETGNIAFRATFPNPKGLLRHGETGTIVMEIPAKHAVIIPQKATMEIMDKKYVYIVDASNVAHLTPITVSASMPDLFVVSEGVKEGDKILLEGLRKVKDKDKIAFAFRQPNDVLQHLRVAAE